MAETTLLRNYFTMVGDDMGNVYRCPNDAVRDAMQPRREELRFCTMEEHRTWPIHVG